MLLHLVMVTELLGKYGVLCHKA